ncbi:hypothetical protein COEREDRAFT_13168 [Coemansia reversa NRRL 1564]|uniref:Alpha-ketoglutarate-dependent dioxygenase AlkB-like domain-containing protein n=1 Tax=Coemansia reversa (strain ATCC 12441 / NRRL 1564) TaxID=763665 RepID=A0A2G5BJJ5_COERN|nr:hypothetical protein COEREDRAFT_13168 [Coemansia reversa NRRL 1564]|eukprot:PIA19173.1 hypothetical protein COEREDRAFT_13168 [Coemansia reversa NRRL 1564]
MQQQTAFRRAEKKHKAQHQLPNLSDVIDVSAIDASDGAAVRRLCLTHDMCQPSVLPFQPFCQDRPPAYTLRDHPGLIVIPNPFTAEAQRWIARKCLCDCTRPPNHTNLDPFFDLPSQSLFSLASGPTNNKPAGALTRVEAQHMVASRVQSDSIDPSVSKPKGKIYMQSAPAADLLERLRWCTLGQQYNWTTKEYDLGTSVFDCELNALMRSIAEAITNPAYAACNRSEDWPPINKYEGSEFVSQAGIINYYHERASMAGHVDKTEESMDAPLISLSIGLSCIYLIGGPTRDTEPTPLLLRSGDILAMCGDSRLAFHGVPRVLSDTAPECLTLPNAGDNDSVAARYPNWHNFATYLSTHRINCNARKCM